MLLSLAHSTPTLPPLNPPRLCLHQSPTCTQAPLSSRSQPSSHSSHFPLLSQSAQRSGQLAPRSDFLRLPPDCVSPSLHDPSPSLQDVQPEGQALQAPLESM